MTQEEFIHKYHGSTISFPAAYSYFTKNLTFRTNLQRIRDLCKKVNFQVVGAKEMLSPRSIAVIGLNGSVYDQFKIGEKCFTMEEFEKDIEQIKTI